MKYTGLLCFVPILAGPLPAIGQVFNDVTGALGITLTLPPLDLGKALSFRDIDGDGWDDLTISTGQGDPLIFLNPNGNLTPESYPITNSGGHTSMLLWADYDNDGDMDLFMSNYMGRLQLWRNDGAGQFTDVALEAGLEQDIHRYAGAAWCDYDHDGCLDLYVAKFYSHEYEPEAGLEYRGMLYRNMCDGTFEHVTEQAGVLIPSAPIFQPVFFDHDKDGWEDLFLVVDRPGAPNELFHNNGDGTFTRISESSGMDLDVCSMSGSIADHDLDGYLDVFISNVPGLGNLLMHNNGDGTFSNVAEELGLTGNLGSAWAGVWMDYDNNGREDLFIGEVSMGQSPGNHFYIQQPDQSFLYANELVGFTDTLETYVAVRGDMNNDGYYDLMTSNNPPYPAKLFKNSGGSNQYLSVSLQGTYSNRDGIGAWLSCYTGGQQQVRFTLSGSDYLGQSSGKYIFGLGQTTEVDSLVVEWNRGLREVYYAIAASQHLHLVEGATLQYEPFPIGITAAPFLCPGASLVLDAGEHQSYLWSTGHDQRFLTVTSPGTYQVTVTDIFGNAQNSLPLTIQATPPFVAQVSAQSISCFGFSDGSVQVEFTNTPLLSIIWSSGETGVTALSGLAYGAYSYTAVDSYGCTDNGGAFIDEPFPLQADIITTPATGGLTNGTALVSITGAVPPYSIAWSSGQADVEFVSGLAPGSYLATITDANGCQLQQPFIIDLSTGMGEQVSKPVFPFPVPAGDAIWLNNCTAHVVEVAIMDLAGRPVRTFPRHPCSDPIPLTGLPAAPYVLWVKHGEDINRYPIVKLDP